MVRLALSAGLSGLLIR